MYEPPARPHALVRWWRNLVDVVWALEHLRLPLAMLLGVTVLGTVGYHLILGVSWGDALYQAMITLSTVGFREVVPFGPGAKLFTNVLIITGVGTVFYTLTLLIATVVEGDLRRNYERRLMKRRIESMRSHCIICGFGRVGQEIADGLRERGVDFVVVERDEREFQRAVDAGYPALCGDATSEEMLVAAGVERATAVLASADSDAVNVYVALTAKNLNPKVQVVARSEETHNERKLRLAGVDKIVSPHQISGRRMMLAALQPLVTDFVDTLSAGRHGEQILAEIDVLDDSPLQGQSLKEAFAEARGTTILGIRRKDGSMIVGPRGDTVLQVGDAVIVLGSEEQIGRLH